jgi:hypothetical protein
MKSPRCTHPKGWEKCGCVVGTEECPQCDWDSPMESHVCEEDSPEDECFEAREERMERDRLLALMR